MIAHSVKVGNPASAGRSFSPAKRFLPERQKHILPHKRSYAAVRRYCSLACFSFRFTFLSWLFAINVTPCPARLAPASRLRHSALGSQSAFASQSKRKVNNKKIIIAHKLPIKKVLSKGVMTGSGFTFAIIFYFAYIKETSVKHYYFFFLTVKFLWKKFLICHIIYLWRRF